MKKCFLSIFVILCTVFAFNAVVYADTNIVLQIDNHEMTVNGEIKPVGIAPTIQSGHTLVPLRSVVEALGGNVEYYGDERQINITMPCEPTIITLYDASYTVKGNKKLADNFMRAYYYNMEMSNMNFRDVIKDLGGKIEPNGFDITLDIPITIDLWIGATAVITNDFPYSTDVPPVIIYGHTMIPLRLVSESLGFNVKWIESNRSIIISDMEITPELEATVIHSSSTSGVVQQSTAIPTTPNNIVPPAVSQKPSIVVPTAIERSGLNFDYGTITFSKTGGQYEGELHPANRTDTSPRGNGKAVWPDGTIYIGGWYDGVPTGWGVYSFPNSNVYEGEITGGAPGGNGVYLWANGEWYDGEWKNGKPSGNGKKGYLNGEVLEGYFINGEFAEGKYILEEFYYLTSKKYFANGDIYEGKFANGQPNGAGILTFANGDRLEGNWSSGQPTGNVTFLYANGDRYVGNWKNGKPDGEGKKTFANGTVQDGTWSNGEFVRARPTPAPQEIKPSEQTPAKSNGGSVSVDVLNDIAEADKNYNMALTMDVYSRSAYMQVAAQLYGYAIDKMKSMGITNTPEYRHCVDRLSKCR